jgi:hypothetical protein
MQSIHLRDVHVPRGPNLRLTAIAALCVFAISLVLFLVFSMMGGEEFAQSMGGDAGLWFLIGGLFVYLVFTIVEMRKS